MTAPAAKLNGLGQTARAVSCLMLGYWGLYALVAPVTTADSQMYHLARLELALRGGLFNNAWFTSVYQLVWPWGFDAVHLPFLELRWGYALPSFACLVGTSSVVHAMLRDKFGGEAAWAAIAALLGLTGLVYQAASTTNDIPLLFCAAVWAYGRWRWRRENRPLHLFWMAVAVGFMAGAKTSGVLYAGILSAVTVWELRRQSRLAGRVAAGLLVSILLLGSVETYVETARVYGHPSGPPLLVQQHRNRDGWKGGVANLSRYVAGSIYVGPVTPGDDQAVTAVLRAEHAWLHSTGLWERGLRADTRDESLLYVQSGFEELSGYGPLGMLAMAFMLVSVVWWRPHSLAWQLTVTAFAGFALLSFTVGFSYWSNRYLCGWYALGTVACVCALWEYRGHGAAGLRIAFVGCALASAVAAPLLSVNRRPTDLVAAVMDRDRFETRNYPVLGLARNELRALRRAHPQSRVYFVVADASLVLPILEDPQLEATVVTRPRFLALLAAQEVKPGDFVIEDNASGAARLIPIRQVFAPDVFVKGDIRSMVIYQVGR
jgi:hypothetical protein